MPRPDSPESLVDEIPDQPGETLPAIESLGRAHAREKVYAALFDMPEKPVTLGRFVILKRLGQGGMGVVYSAHDPERGCQVAVKLVRSAPGRAGERARQRLLREAAALTRLVHPNIVAVHEVGVHENQVFIAMELLAGMDLATMLRTTRRLVPADAIDLLLQACDGLAAAHALDIVHRDIKPANLFVTHRADGSRLLKVLDFGLSKAPVTMMAAITSTQSVMGTPAYMSPEQLRSGKLADARSDIWSLGVVLYELLHGRLPFPARTYPELCRQVTLEPPLPFDVALPSTLKDALLRCLAKRPPERFQSVAELAAALAPLAGDRADTARPAARAGSAPGAEEVARQGTPGVEEQPRDRSSSEHPTRGRARSAPAFTRRHWLAIAAGLGLVAGAAAALWLGLGGAPASEERERASTPAPASARTGVREDEDARRGAGREGTTSP
jgi:serine/threonine protein kinase